MKYFIASCEFRTLDSTDRTSLRGEFVQLSDGVTHFEMTGPADGDIVVLTGGITVPLFYWDDTAAALHDRGFRTLAYSAYGRGYSDRVHSDYDQNLFVRQLSELITALGLTAPHHLVGASMGALVAMEFARRLTETPLTLALIGPAGLSPRPAVQRVMMASDLVAGQIARRLGRRIFDHHQGRNVSDPLLATKLRSMVDQAYEYEGSQYAFFQTLQHFPLFDQADLYRDTGLSNIPVMLMWGTDDLVTPIHSLEDVRGLVRPERLHVVDDCGHMVPFEQPTLVAEQVAAFITSHRDSVDR